MNKRRGQRPTIFQKKNRKGRRKKGVVSEYLPWLLIGLAILVVVMIAIFLLKGKGLEFIEQIKNIFKGR